MDLRSQAEIDKDGAIDGNVHISMDQFFTSLDKLPTDLAAPIVLYCASGHRGGIMLLALNMLGYTNVRNLGGGINAWTAAELPLEQ